MKPITIIGGGLSGLALGILLRRENVPVILFEAGRYPRHKVCGEFLSGTGKKIFTNLQNSVGIEAKDAALFLPNKKAVGVCLEEPALCLSRYEMDQGLAEEFKRLGGELCEGQRRSSSGDGVVQASGRKRADAAGGHLIGIKAHARGAKFSADLELHFKPNRYVGICRLSEERVNVCGLFYSAEPIRELHDTWKQMLAESIPALGSAVWMEESFCAVAGITLDRNWEASEFSIGDAAAMIPPLTGNGMSMAFESATIAAPVLIRFSAGKLSWGEALESYAAHWRRAFRSRLRWASFTQRLAFNGRGQQMIFALMKMCPSLPPLFFSKTR